MKKENRLIKNHDFTKVMNRRQRFMTPALSVYYCRNSLGHLRVGISVGKKVGKAVLRVKIRRQLRAMIALYGSYGRDFDVVIIVRPCYPKYNFDELYRGLAEVLDRFLKEEPDEKKN